MACVLITGGSGFIGTHLAKALIGRGDRVVSFDIRPPAEPMRWLLGGLADQVTHCEGTVEDWPSLVHACTSHGVTHIAHLASPIDTAYLDRHPKVALDTIIAGTVNVLETARVLSLARVVYFSSIGVLPACRYEPIDADHPVILGSGGPASGAYGAGKLAAEALCFAYRESYDLDFVILRPSAAYGFKTGNLIYLPQFIEGALAGEPVRFSHGGAVPRDYTHVADIAGIAAAALAVEGARLRNRIFYAATGEPLVTAAQAADIVRELVPGADLAIAPELDRSDRLEIGFRGRLDIAPVIAELGFTPTYRDLRDGVAETVATYRRWLGERAA